MWGKTPDKKWRESVLSLSNKSTEGTDLARVKGLVL